MRNFLRENWLYIVAPLVIVLIVLVCLILFSDGSPSVFNYPIF